MSDNLTSADGAEAVSANASFTIPTYDLSPDDQHIADAITGLDPFAAIKSGARAGDGFAVTALPPLSALSPSLRAEVEQRLQGTPAARHAEAEADAIAAVLAANSRSVRPLLGNGEGSTAYHNELVDLAREYRDGVQEWNRISADMATVARYDTSPDGPIPIYAMGQAATRAAVSRLAELDHRLGLLMDADGNHGPEATRRLAKALAESVEAKKARTAEIEEMREAEALADKMVRDERIAAKAAGLAKRKRGPVQ